MASLALCSSAFLDGECAVRASQESSQCARRYSVCTSTCVSIKCVAQCDQSEAAGNSKGKAVVMQNVSSRRQAVCALISGSLVLPLSAPQARALLESDDDDALLEKVKEDKKKRIQKRSTAINDFRKETESVQAAVYNLSKAGQAIDGGDFSTATSVLATDWIKDLKAALSKVSMNSDELSEADTFSSALTSLQAAVKKGDAESSRSAFVTSASALEKWTRLTGLSEQMTGL